MPHKAKIASYNLA